MNKIDKLRIHGVPGSQPSRTVYWICLLKGLPFVLDTGPRDRVDNTYLREEFLKLNPLGMFPVIEDGEICLSQMPAILIYLCEKHGWHDLYPNDFLLRSKINEYLFNHVTFTRLCTLKLMAPHVTPAFPRGGPGDADDCPDPTLREMINTAIARPDKLASGQRTVRRMAGVIDSAFFGPDTPYLMNAPKPTIADIACYGEVAQLQWAGLFDYSEFPKLSKWLDAMTRVPHHDLVHRYNFELGDILQTPNTLDRFIGSSKVALQELAEFEGVEITTS